MVRVMSCFRFCREPVMRISFLANLKNWCSFCRQDDVVKVCLVEVVTGGVTAVGDKRMVDVAARLVDWVRDPELRRELEQWAAARSVPTVV